MKVALYARVSTDDKGQDPETQLLQLRDFCQRAGWEIWKEYVDQARAKDYAGRKSWTALQRDARQRRFGIVMVRRLDRAWRSVRECCNQLEEWESIGVKFVSTSQDIDTSTAMGRYFLYNMAAAAELESSLISDRVIDGIERRRREGKSWGRRRLGHSSQSICEAIVDTGSISLAARQLECSVPYIYKMLQPLGINPSRLAKGELKLSAALELIKEKEGAKV